MTRSPVVGAIRSGAMLSGGGEVCELAELLEKVGDLRRQ